MTSVVEKGPVSDSLQVTPSGLLLNPELMTSVVEKDPVMGQ